jgi:hypothetical protein
MAPPFYWVAHGATQKRPWALVLASDEEVKALSGALAPGGTLGGRDQRTSLDYSGFKLSNAWRLQHFGLWGKYAMERENMKKFELPTLEGNGIQLPSLQLRRQYNIMISEMPAQLDPSLHEVYLSHGSKPESVLAILSGGLNERFSGGLFGKGTYLAEDVAKNDQYCTYDKKYGEHPELHAVLFDDTGAKHEGDLLYVFFCRVVLGCFIRTKDGKTDLDRSGASVWASSERELAVVHGSNPPVHHHALVAEVGAKILRFREFITFHGDRIYPEYLVAYQRVRG